MPAGGSAGGRGAASVASMGIRAIGREFKAAAATHNELVAQKNAAKAAGDTATVKRLQRAMDRSSERINALSSRAQEIQRSKRARALGDALAKGFKAAGLTRTFTASGRVS